MPVTPCAVAQVAKQFEMSPVGVAQVGAVPVMQSVDVEEDPHPRLVLLPMSRATTLELDGVAEAPAVQT